MSTLWNFDSDTVKGDIGLYAKWKEKDAYIAFYNLKLGEDISIGFCMHIADTLKADPNLKMEFTIPGETNDVIIVPFSEAAPRTVNGEQYYLFFCPVVAKEMIETVSARLIGGDASEPVVYADGIQQSVRGYSQKILASAGYHNNAKALVKSMLNYGTAAQTYFNWKTEDPANNILSDEDKIVPAYDFSVHGETVTGTMPEGLTYKGCTLMCESKTAIRFYFEGDITNMTFTVDGKNIEAIQKNNMWYIQPDYIKAAELGKSIALKVTDGTNTWSITISVWDYAKKIQTGGKSPELLAVMTAMHDYWVKTEAYRAAPNE